MNNIVSPTPPVGARDGNWVWDGTRWVCDPDCFPPQFPCPSPFPPAFSGPAQQPPWYPGANGGVSFSQTPPPNPVRGHFWWDGTVLHMFDGAAWVAVGAQGASPGGGGTPPSGTPPANPVPGQQWFNGTTLFVWDGNAWVPVSQTKTSIQATAPSAPNPGDLWFDGTQLRIWSGSAWMLVGPGATVGPVPTTTIVFGMTATVARPITASTWQIVPFNDQPLMDTMNGWDSIQHKYTPNRAGIYAFSIRGATVGVALLKNDPGTFTNALTSDIIITISTQPSGWNSSFGMAQMNGTSDYVRFWGNSSTGSFPASGGNPLFIAALMP